MRAHVAEENARRERFVLSKTEFFTGTKGPRFWFQWNVHRTLVYYIVILYITLNIYNTRERVTVLYRDDLKIYIFIPDRNIGVFMLVKIKGKR